MEILVLRPLGNESESTSIIKKRHLSETEVDHLEKEEVDITSTITALKIKAQALFELNDVDKSLECINRYEIDFN